jgi:hypothetical protein
VDILFKLRLIFWVLVFALWGSIFREFYHDAPPPVPKIQPVKNPYRSALAGLPGPPEAGHRDIRGSVPDPFLPPSPERLSEPPLPGPLPAEAPEEPLLPVAPEGYAGPSAEPPAAGKPEPPAAEKAEPARPRKALRRSRPRELEGFELTESRHFYLYSQSEPDPAFLETVETLHLNLMVDLAPFAPWAREEKVTLYLFDDQGTYRRYTGRPEWSGGASSLSRRAAYVYQSEDLMGILAHELCHIYFDSFFEEAGQSPLWLSEGLATLVQAERGFAPPNWLAPNLERLQRGAGYPLERLVRVTTTSGAADDDVRLWYAQSYSVVRFLLRMQRGPAFLHFARTLRDGQPLNRSLLAAYGMPYNRLKALEHAWRHDLSVKRVTLLPDASPPR